MPAKICQRCNVSKDDERISFLPLLILSAIKTIIFVYHDLPADDDLLLVANTQYKGKLGKINLVSANSLYALG